MTQNDQYTGGTERDVEYWRCQAELSDDHEWCESCEMSYFDHFDECPHPNHETRHHSVSPGTDNE